MSALLLPCRKPIVRAIKRGFATEESVMPFLRPSDFDRISSRSRKILLSFLKSLTQLTVGHKHWGLPVESLEIAEITYRLRRMPPKGTKAYRRRQKAHDAILRKSRFP